jgi:acetyl esterase/lipase
MKRSVLTSLALLFSSGFCLAVPCPGANNDDFEALPQREWLPQDYQPSRYDTDDETVLRRVRFAPDPAVHGSGPYPTVISIPATLFRSGECYGGQSQRVATRELKEAGYLVFQVEHRLAPPNTLWGQDQHDPNTQKGRESGRPPQQSNDIKQQILAALADPNCNGDIFLIGGSSGGTHALWMALDPAPTVPEWNANKVAKIKAVVSFSGPTYLSWRDPDPNQDIDGFIDTVENYTNTKNDPTPEPEQYDASPIKFVEDTTNTLSYIPPIRMYATEGDSVPYQQGADMRAAFDIPYPSADVEFYLVNNGSLHAFNYWHEQNEAADDVCVSTQVIEFFDAFK